MTVHRYPLRGCITDPHEPVLRRRSRTCSTTSPPTGLAQQVAPYVATAHAAALPFRLDELNSVSCSGARGVSDTFASALWVLDTLFNLAAVGVDGVNIHTLPGAAYELFNVHPDRGTWRRSSIPSTTGC